MKKRDEPPVKFVTDSGKKMILIFENNEYRAYELTGGGKKELKLGSASAESLMEYIKERW